MDGINERTKVMRHLKHSTKLFLLGWIVGGVAGAVGYNTPALLSLRFSLLDLNAATVEIITNNLTAAFFSALGPLLAAKLLKIKPKDIDGIAFLYMIPTVILFLNGFSVGFFTGSLATKLTPTLMLLSLAPHGILEIPAILMSGAIGFTNVEDLGKKGIVDKKYLPLILVFILMGGFIEGNVTGQLSQLREPIKIVELKGPETALASADFHVNITIENSGIIDSSYYLILSGDVGALHGGVGAGLRERMFEDSSIPLGSHTFTKEVSLDKPGENTLTASIMHDYGAVSRRELKIEIMGPHVSIGAVEVPSLFAGEEATINISVENGDDLERTVEVVFKSTTGAMKSNFLTLAPKETKVYQHQTLIGQPGPRRFDITVLWNGFTLTMVSEKTLVHPLRIRPVITSIDVPKLVVNRTSIISIEVENVGTKGGDVSILAFDSRMPQLHRRLDSIRLEINKEHLGTGLLAFNDLYLEPGQKRQVNLEITPMEKGPSTLLVFALKREVISDAATVEINPEF